jgi:hypothetical protein
MANITTIEEAKKEMLIELKKSLSVATDLDLENGIDTFFIKGGYDMNKSFDINKKSCIQYLAIRKAYKK